MAQAIRKEQEKMEKKGQRHDILVSEVETDDGDSGNEDANNDGSFLDINTRTVSKRKRKRKHWSSGSFSK